MKKGFTISIFIVVILLLAGIFIWNATTKHTNQINNSSINRVKPLPKEKTIILDTNGFNPKEITVTIGSAVRWINKSGSQQTVNSDNYPTNKLHRELNFGTFNNGSSFVYTFTKPGTYGFHNQFHHEQEGKIIVVE